MAGSKGGRGGKAGSNTVAPDTNSAANIVFSDGTYFRYIESDGKVYEISGEVPREINTTLSLAEITKNAEGMGATVEKLSDDDLKEIDRRRAQSHSEWDKILSRAELSLKRYFTSKTRAKLPGRERKCG